MIKMLFKLICFLLFYVLFLPPPGWTAVKTQNTLSPNKIEVAVKVGEKVETEFFDLKIPSNWFMPYPVNHKPDSVSAVFGNQKNDVTVTVNVIQAPLSLKAFVDNVLPGMKKSGLDPGKPTMENGLYKVVFKGKLKGMAWFGSNGKLCSALIVLSQYPDIAVANELLSVIKFSPSNLFPKKI